VHSGFRPSDALNLAMLQLPHPKRQNVSASLERFFPSLFKNGFEQLWIASGECSLVQTE
jgi:hypothetical protein